MWRQLEAKQLHEKQIAMHCKDKTTVKKSNRNQVDKLRCE